MKAICGFIFPNATFTKSSSLNENVASGFPPSYGPKYPCNQIIIQHSFKHVLPKIHVKLVKMQGKLHKINETCKGQLWLFEGTLNFKTLIQVRYRGQLINNHSSLVIAEFT